MITKIKELLPANRLAAIIGFCAAIGAALAALQTSFVPGSPASEAIAKAIAFVGSVGAGAAIVLKFLEGSQNWDSLMVNGAPKVPGATVVVNQDGTLVTGTEGMIDTPDDPEDEMDDSYVGPDPDAPTDDLPPGGHPMDEARLAGFGGEGGRQSLGMQPERPEAEGQG